MSAEPTGGLTSRAVRAFGWAVASFGLHKLITFFGTLVLARILVPEDFGLVAAGMALLAFLEIALDLGVGSTVIYEQERGITRRVQTAFTLNMCLALVLAGLGVLAAPYIAAFFQAPDETALFRAMFLYLFLKAASQIPDAVLRRDLDFKRRLAAETSRAVVRIGLAIPLAMAGMGAWSIVLGMIAGEAVGVVVIWFAARFRPRLILDRAALGTLLSFGTAMLGVRVVAELGSNADYFIVGNRLGPSDLGIYTIAYRVPELVLLTVFWLYGMVAFPVYSQAGALDPTKLKPALLRSTRLTTLFALPAGVGLAIVAHDAIHVLFSERWAAAVGPMMVVSLAMAAGAIPVASTDVLPAVGKPGVLLRVNLTILPPQLVAMVFATRYGLTEVALAHLAGSIAYVPLLQRHVNRVVGATARDIIVAVGPAAAAAVGVLVTALPVRLLLESGPLRLTTTIAAGVVGGVAGLYAGGRGMVPELRELVGTLVRKAA